MPFAGGATVIHHFRHALALDERRAFYKYQPWLGREADARNVGYSVKEVWFAGSHSDVGGGAFPYDGDQHALLAHIPLRWMAREAVEQGLVLSPERVKDSPVFRPSKRVRYQPTELLRYDCLASTTSPPGGPVSATRAASYPQSDRQIMERVFEAADQLLWTHESASAPRTDCLSFRLAKTVSEESRPDSKRFRRAKTFSSRLCRRIGAAAWWLPELLPHLKLVEERDKKGYLKLRCVEGTTFARKSAANFSARISLRLNLGRGRKVPRDATIHRSVLDRINADADVLQMQHAVQQTGVKERSAKEGGVKEGGAKKRGGQYSPRARFAVWPPQLVEV